MAARLFIRIDFEPSGSALGPGMLILLDQIETHGSIRQAAKFIGMSYRKAWGLLHAMEHTFEGPVITTEIGGNSGGGTRLTELGHKLMLVYRNVQKRVEQATATDVEMIAAMVRSDAKPRLKRKGRRNVVPQSKVQPA